jgi:thioredoxin reductase (NADPH)
MAERTLSHDKIEMVWNSEVTEVTDVEQDKVTGVKVRNTSGDERTIDCAGLFIAIGHVPNTQLFQGVIDMDDAGYILPKRGQETNVTGVFVAGDCSDKVYRQAVTAAGQGCAAAIEAERYLASLDQ